MEIKITLPFPLVTWNRILAMRLRERMKCKKLVHQLTSMSIANAKGLQTQTDFQRNGSLMPLLKAEYLEMIRPSTSKRSRILKRKVVQKRFW